jgi:hypothetical protein
MQKLVIKKAIFSNQKGNFPTRHLTRLKPEDLGITTRNFTGVKRGLHNMPGCNPRHAIGVIARMLPVDRSIKFAVVIP